MSVIDLTDSKPMRVRVAYALNLHQVNIMIMVGDVGEEVEKQFYVDHCDIQCPCETELTDDGIKRRMYMLCQVKMMNQFFSERGDTLILIG